MKREEMNRIIKFELEYIPNGSTGSIQNKLRYHYNLLRRRGMAKGMSREECLKNAIQKLKKDHPNFNPKFDQEFFTINKKPSQANETAKRLLGVILGVLVSSLLTYAAINTFHYVLDFQGIITLLSIVAVGALVGGLTSANYKIGLLTGLLAGIIAVPLVAIYLSSLMQGVSLEFLLAPEYTQSLGTYILFGLVGGTVGTFGAWIGSKLLRIQ